ncbi:hypothetical protein BDP27DRAFT_1146541, partial [Rhodocollybia butyracea]
RKPWRTRTKRVAIKLTAGQKTERKRKRAAQKLSYKQALLDVHQQIYAAAAEIHERFPQLSVDLIVTDIFQSERLQSATKDVGRYSAFVSLESKRLNAEVPEGQPRRKVHEMSSEIAAKWREMSEEEKDVATKGELAHLRDRRANKEIGEHRVPAAAAHDSFLTLERVQENLERLNIRTGDEHLLISTRGSNKVFHKPFVFASSDRVVEFFNNAYKDVPTEMGYRMDAFMVSGVEEECVGRTKVGRMVYVGFIESITRRYGIIVKNWPLPEFKNPSSVGTKTELDILWNAWNTDATHFYRMTSSEHSEW